MTIAELCEALKRFSPDTPVYFDALQPIEVSGVVGGYDDDEETEMVILE